ncbi:hypothetical protein TNCV_3263651 [Trichonephila clavipes]|nr:hypothetical protein TNCV_3263651 [Trichonephila clavipes]
MFPRIPCNKKGSECLACARVLRKRAHLKGVPEIPACEECPRRASIPFITGYRKKNEVLLEVAIDLGVEVNSTLTKSEIKHIIYQSEDYDEESIKSLLEGILAEKRETKESEREAKELKENHERETREF